MAFSMAGGGPSSPQMNVTPLIDVLLVLIIIFMVIVTEQKDKGLDAQIPQEQPQTNAPPPVDRTIVIEVQEGANGEPPTLKINQQDVKWDDLQPRLHDIFKARAERVAFVKGDDEVDFQYVADVIDLAREAGVDRVGLLTERRWAARALEFARHGARQAIAAWMRLLEAESFVHQPLQSWFVENVVGKFFIRKHRQGRALGIGRHL